MATTKQVCELLTVYARNIDLLLFKRGWSLSRLAREAGVTVPTLTRVRLRHNKYIDPELFEALLRVFDCNPDELLLPHPGIDYTVTPEDDDA